MQLSTIFTVMTAITAASAYTKPKANDNSVYITHGQSVGGGPKTFVALSGKTSNSSYCTGTNFGKIPSGCNNLNTVFLSRLPANFSSPKVSNQTSTADLNSPNTPSTATSPTSQRAGCIQLRNMHKVKRRMSEIAVQHLSRTHSHDRDHSHDHNPPTTTPQDHEPQPSTTDLLRANVTPFHSISDAGDTFARSFDSFGAGNTKILMIGDASHGTSEFYAARAQITRYMIQHHGFNIVAVEADWPDADAVDRYVRHRGGVGPPASVEPEGVARKAGREPAFMRFPTWMWRNVEVQEFVEWLRDWNKSHGAKKDAVGFYGLDLYSLRTSMQAVIEYLDHVDKGMADTARERYRKLITWAQDPHEYGLEALVSGFKGYEDDAVRMLKELLDKRLEYSSVTWDGIEYHGCEQNAILVKDAEHYYREMYYAHNESWNLRDRHMFETLLRVLKHRGHKSKAIVWAHNSHIGDARATSMGWLRGEFNVGQLCKAMFGDRALSIGCSTYTGTVAAAMRWGADMSVMHVKPALPNSYEHLMHATGIKNFVLDLRHRHCDKELRKALMEKRLERFIGVIYAPETERQSHYSFAVLPEQLDGLVWFEETRYVGALEVHQPRTPLEFGETWPFGV
ncbi:erythromycin esterase-domain-containing protein [Bombardia bombarda]|uniref:Erythromycin esterase-domain-containing protein n=1 Tax=Bombardia bombarda TaxID=252184 RepID=A0AA39XLS8_9PEZI|nr:erythromycin esterase-domain-containing protein [Bombardia bombarda]